MLSEIPLGEAFTTTNLLSSFFLFLFEVLYSQKIKTLKSFKIKSKENKISHGRGNSLRNKVRGWVDLDSPDPLKPLPTG